MIAFDPQSPVVTDALRQWRGRVPFPTDMSSRELRGLAREVAERSVFSARTTHAGYVQNIQDEIDALLSGKHNLATARRNLMRRLKELGYHPEGTDEQPPGFPQDMADVPPADRGSLQDLSSEMRLDLVLETNSRMAANYGRMIAGNRPYALRAYPAWELVRIFQRDVPRGTPESHSPGWQRRWSDAGDAVDWEGAATDRLMARKDSPIWQALGDGAGGHDDTLGNPYPPYAFRSGMGWREVPAAEWESVAGAIGLPVEPMQAELSPGQKEVRAAVERLSPELREALREELLAA